MTSSEPVFIFCRGGSKGIPKKNIKPLNGKPLLAWTIEFAKKLEICSKVIVSTDCNEISNIASSYGATVLLRPASLATDSSDEFLAWKHAVLSFQNEISSKFICLPATSPLRSSIDIHAALLRFNKGDCDLVYGVTPSHRSPYLNMVRLDNNNLVHTVIDSSFVRRQDVPITYDVTTVAYIASKDFIIQNDSLSEANVGAFKVPYERSLDIDYPFDLHLASLLKMYPFTP